MSLHWKCIHYMKIKIKELIEQQKIEFDENIDLRGLFSEDDGVIYLHVKGTAVYTPNIAIVDCVINGEIEKLCNKCLEVSVNKYTAELHQHYDINPFDQDILLDEDIRQAFLLELPLSYVCKESCKGLCPQCGTNLNISSCKCGEKITNTPFDSLKKLLKDKNNKEVK
jgi:uncharacterized protein